MLRLQCGRYDDPDRLFCSMRESWESVNGNPADVKELIPEFCMVEESSFLQNVDRLPLGVRQSGEVVGDVSLPPWCEGDAATMVRVMRAALESEYVSRSLHHLIDLAFRMPAARKRGRRGGQPLPPVHLRGRRGHRCDR